MAAPALPRIVIDGEDGSTLALATIDIIDPDVVRASLHVSPGHLPPGTRTRLVDAVPVPRVAHEGLIARAEAAERASLVGAARRSVAVPSARDGGFADVDREATA